MLVGDDNVAAVVTAILAAAVIRNSGVGDPAEAVAIFQEIGAALQHDGALSNSVGTRRVSGHRDDL